MRLPFARFTLPAFRGRQSAPASTPVALELYIECAMQSEVGRVRTTNEDAVAFVAPDAGSPESSVGFLALVADGMGGHAAGEMASAIAAETIPRVVYAFAGAPAEALAKALGEAHQAILEYAEVHPDAQGMGTTCTAALVREGDLWLAQVGDSRAYLFRDGVLERLTEDQTLHAQLMRDGVMTPEEAAAMPGGNIILQALGARKAVSPVVSDQPKKLLPGDLLLLCSDGLHGYVAEKEIAAVLTSGPPGAACRALIDRANAAGGFDNVSVGVFRFTNSPPVRARAGAATRALAADGA